MDDSSLKTVMIKVVDGRNFLACADVTAKLKGRPLLTTIMKTSPDGPV